MQGSFKIQLINMGTRAAAFTAKIRSLYECQFRLQHGIQPLPSGIDISSTIKYFSQTLLTVLKDVPSSPLEMLRDPENDIARMNLYPNLDYKGLYNAISQMVDVASCVQYGLHAFGQAILQCLGCLLPFLECDMIESLPYLAASCVAVLPVTLHQEIINLLCFYILPFTITRQYVGEEESQASRSVAAVIMMVFQHSNNPAHHCQLLECLMTLKPSVVKDVLCVIAYGTSAARASAAKLLFYHWPAFNANLFDRKGLLCKFSNDLTPFVCQRDMCPNAGNAEAAKVCFDHCISVTFASDTPPPLYLCIECANEIHREHPDQRFLDILHPMQQISMVCENKNCRSNDKSAYSICFSGECASYNGNHPIRFCRQCHANRHNSKRGGDHVVHHSLPPAWQMHSEMQTYLVESIVSLLKEAKPLNVDDDIRDLSDSFKSQMTINPPTDHLTLEERQLLGRYGVWLMVGLCTPNKDTPVEILGRLISMLFHWFHITAYSYDGPTESIVEKLKTEHVCGWLTGIGQTDYTVLISCLLPHPPEYARVGGHWDTFASRTSHLKDGLNRLFCLVPYDIITTDIWDYIMPHWMEAITNDVPEKELPEFKGTLSKILDPDLSPLGFTIKKMYRFVATRFEKTSAKVQQQALHWLQVLSLLEILIPLPHLFEMFGYGVKVMKTATQDQAKHTSKHVNKNGLEGPYFPVNEDDSPSSSNISDDEGLTNRQNTVEFETDAEHNLTCCIIMLDILIKQMELQTVEHRLDVSEDATRLLRKMLRATCVRQHTVLTPNTPDSKNGSKSTTPTNGCGNGDKDCGHCEAAVLWHQLAVRLVKMVAPEKPAHPPDPPIDDLPSDGSHSRKSPPPDSDKIAGRGGAGDMIINMPLPLPIPEIHSVGGVLVHMPHIMTATVETVSEQLELAAIMPGSGGGAVSDTADGVDSLDTRNGAKEERATAAVITESDVAQARARTACAAVVGSDEKPEDIAGAKNLANFWQTSVGRFHFTIDELPQNLQYIHQILQELPNADQPDILYYLLQCLYVLVLHGDVFTKAAKDHKGFFIWCQENLLIKNLWDVCNAQYSHICEVSVPLLLHCITLTGGADVFWRLIQAEFHHTDWRVRFTAVERVTVITRFMDSTPLRNVLPLQTALATAFCYLISSMDDINVYVAQRSTLYIGTIHDHAVKSLLHCLETQFDSVIVDRPMVLQSIYQLHNSLSDRKILSWDFFLNRFDALFLEAQINLEKSGDISYFRDLRNSETNSEAFVHKLRRAHEALSHSGEIAGSGVGVEAGIAPAGGPPPARTLSASFGTKWPYKRTMSAPATMLPRQDTRQEKEKVYSRQYSAPILKRKSSRFGLDNQFHSLSGCGWTTDDAALANLLPRMLDLEEADRETTHLLVFLLMQFMSRSDQAHPEEDKLTAKSQNIVLKHLYLLLGYNQNDKGFHIAPQRLRRSAVFNAFLSNLPQVLDQNHAMGWSMCEPTLALLLYCPAPVAPPSTPSPPPHPHYSLWMLEPHARRNWLMAVLVLLYKYEYRQQPTCSLLQSAVKIVLNTLDAQHHVCKRIPAMLVMPQSTARSRDASQPSLGGLGGSGVESDIGESPPASPAGGSSVMSAPLVSTARATRSPAMETHWEESTRPKRHQPWSLDRDSIESELVAIPETSDRSDATMPGSTAPGSFDDPSQCDDGLPLKLDHLTSNMMVTGVNKQYTANALEITKGIQKLVENRSDKKSEKMAKKPLWFMGSDDDTLQDGESQRWGIREGVRMMVTSSLMSATDHHHMQQPSHHHHTDATTSLSALTTQLTASQSTTQQHVKGLEGSAKHDVRQPSTNELKSDKDSKPTHTIQIIGGDPNHCNQITMRASTGSSSVSVSSDSSNVRATVGCGQSKDVWSEAGSHGTPVQKSLGRQKRIVVSGGSSSPDTGPSSNGDGQFGPWQVGGTPRSPLQPPNIERLLPIGQAHKPNNPYTSPESPLSKMELLSCGSSDHPSSDGGDLTSPLLDTVHLKHTFDIPAQERLLPIGPLANKEPYPVFNALVDRVRGALGIIPDTLNSAVGSSSIGLSDTAKCDDFRGPSSIEGSPRSRGASPRRLMKQVALLESPSGSAAVALQPQTALLEPEAASGCQSDILGGYQMPNHSDESGATGASASVWWGGIRSTDDSSQRDRLLHEQPGVRLSATRCGDDCVVDRCSECGTGREEYSDEELGLCIIVLATFVHREPAAAAPLLPEILTVVSKMSVLALYGWQSSAAIHLPGGAVSVAQQFLRCVLHQLAPNAVFVQIFQTRVPEKQKMMFFKSIATALVDFNELNPTGPLQLLTEFLNSKKTLPTDQLPIIIENMACYMDCLPLEALGPGSSSGALLQQLDTLFRRIILLLNVLEDITPLMRIMVSILKVPAICQFKSLLDPFSKILSYAIQNFVVKYNFLLELSFLCNRAFTKERDKLMMCRIVIFELVQALKFKTTIPDENFLMIIRFILQDSGGYLPLTPALEECLKLEGEVNHEYATGASDCMRQYLSDVLDFLADFHTLTKIKSYSKGLSIGLNEDTLGGVLKSGIAQYVALEITRGNNRDNRAIARYMPWLYNAPSALQQGPREFTECVSHMRLLSWLLIGALSHGAIKSSAGGAGNNTSSISSSIGAGLIAQPVPQEASCHIADHIQVIMAGFAEQSKASVLHMSSLFHAFILCQLWTVYLEHISNGSMLNSEAHNITMSILFDFWGKVTPCILQLVSHSKMLAETVNLHFLSLLEALLECNSTVLNKLLPLWSPVLFSHHIQLPGHLHVRLEQCRNFAPSPLPHSTSSPTRPQPVLLRWLQRLQFKMAQIELQSSTVTQFYFV